MIEAHILASGSTGNSMLYTFGHTRILVDCGLGIRKLKSTMEEAGYGLNDLDAVLITHEHSDHVKSLESLIRHTKGNVPIVTREATQRCLPGGNSDMGTIYQPINGEAKIGGVEIEAFNISHDAIDPVGFLFRYGGKTLVSATDLGMVTPEVEAAIDQADILIFEANHDLGILANGPYPYFLQNRIKGKRGHLSNGDAAQALANLSVKKRDIFLAHLSRQNNTPDAALDAVKVALEESGHQVDRKVKIQLAWADRVVSQQWD